MPPPKPLVFCKFLRRRCRKCGRRFWKKDRKINPCPDCGEDRTCGRPVVPHFNYCQEHGGPNVSVGKYGVERMTRFPIVKLSQKYAAMRTDARILSNRAAMELIRDRIQQLTERIDMAEAPDRMKKLYALWAEYRKEWNKGHEAQCIILAKQIDDEFERVYHDYAAWEQIFQAVELDSKLVEREVTILTKMKAILSVEDAHELIAKILGIITEEVHDPDQLRRIQYKFVKLIGESASDEPKREKVVDAEAED